MSGTTKLMENTFLTFLVKKKNGYGLHHFKNPHVTNCNLPTTIISYQSLSN